MSVSTRKLVEVNRFSKVRIFGSHLRRRHRTSPQSVLASDAKIRLRQFNRPIVMDDETETAVAAGLISMFRI